MCSSSFVFEFSEEIGLRGCRAQEKFFHTYLLCLGLNFQLLLFFFFSTGRWERAEGNGKMNPIWQVYFLSILQPKQEENVLELAAVLSGCV